MATEILRPNVAGDEENIYNSTEANNCEAVDEETADDDISMNYTQNTGATHSERDLYNLPAHSEGSGIINSITVYAKCKSETAFGVYGAVKIVVKSNSTITEDDWQALTTSWANYSKQWTTNPADSQAWQWADIDALQIGVSLNHVYHLEGGDIQSYVTQVYVVVDYTPVPTGGAGAAAELVSMGVI